MQHAKHRTDDLAGLIVLALALTACAATPAATPAPTVTMMPAPTATATATSTPTPTLTLTPTSTPTPTPGPGLDDLMQTPAALYLNADLQGAASAYSALTELYPHRAEPWLGLAAVALRDGDVEAALDYLYSAVEAEPASFEAWRQLGVLLDQQGRVAEVVEVYTRLIGLVPTDPALYVARALAYARLGQGEAAVADLESARSLDPHQEHAWLNVAGAAYGVRAYRAAVEIASAGLEVYPASIGLLIQRGQAALSLGDADSALADFDSALALDERHYTALYWRGQALVALERYNEAVEAFQRAGELGVGEGAIGTHQAYEAIAAAADVLARSDPQAAFAYLADRVIRYGQPPDLLLGYALIEYRRGGMEAAFSRLNNLITLYDFVPAYYWRAVVEVERGDTAAAIADLQAYLAVRRAGPQVEAARELLRSLGVDPDTVQQP